MTSNFDIIAAATAQEFCEAALLFELYASTLPIDLNYQDFQTEVSGLPGKYAAPSGGILLAYDTARQAVGCIGHRALPLAGSCEMKRLFTVPRMRGTGLGHALTKAVIDHARALGYKEMKLDTLPTMATAKALYYRLGFLRCDPYYAPTPEGTVFMTLTL